MVLHTHTSLEGSFKVLPVPLVLLVPLVLPRLGPSKNLNNILNILNIKTPVTEGYRRPEYDKILLLYAGTHSSTLAHTLVKPRSWAARRPHPSSPATRSRLGC